MNLPLKQLINSTRGRLAFSVLLGLGLATLFRKACNSRNCLVFKAPSLEEKYGKVFQFNNKCFKFAEKSVSCSDPSDPSKNITTIDV